MVNGQRLILDTHVLVWVYEDDPRLGAAAREVITNPGNQVFVSAASIWEIAIKQATGKLGGPDNLGAYVERFGFTGLPITLRHAERAGRLPLLHRDPFDRMLVAQAQTENLTLITGDASIARYAVPTLSAAE